MIANLKAASLRDLSDELIRQHGATFIVSGQREARRNVVSIKAEMDRRDREAAKPHVVWLVLGEHFHVPGLVQKVFPTKKAADVEALELINMMLVECERKPVKNWKRGLEWLCDNHDSVDVCVNELTVEG